MDRVLKIVEEMAQLQLYVEVLQARLDNFNEGLLSSQPEEYIDGRRLVYSIMAYLVQQITELQNELDERIFEPIHCDSAYRVMVLGVNKTYKAKPLAELYRILAGFRRAG